MHFRNRRTENYVLSYCEILHLSLTICKQDQFGMEAKMHKAHVAEVRFPLRRFVVGDR